ncbi:Lactocepin [Lentibacillus sp. JNUCC-1]|uniref:S8 family serine peptidase n=1 Tax=Lentibacillus sp. JNUCC-1 TaxID=2654513 RepID=UPI0013225E06|nr:S8 family serine peptidase [Lentibacillus sp. JNUCC-1]MUV37306.1 Lactocepin [Lentibacillus sp. JNUCC-1]
MKIKRILVLLLAFMLVFSNSTFAATGSLSKNASSKKSEIVNNKQKFMGNENDEKYNDDEKVRVIVEVEGNPAITYATEKGKKFSSLAESQKTDLQEKALKTQQNVKENIANKKVKVEYEQSFTTVFNGFSGIVEYGDSKRIEKLPGVTSVTVATEYERPIVEPEMKYSKELVQAQRTWDEYGYDGEGMVVGVIDTGIDPTHKDMVLTDPSKAKLTEEKVASGNYPGKFFTDKIPYGYNYMDESYEIRDIGPEASMHGMHVSGTVGANGDEDNGGIKGVAPEAQLLALKVFGNDPQMGSTWGDIYIKAIDDAIQMGADALNMSLGSTAAFVDSDSPEQQAVKRAVENGVIMSISAGNSAHLGNGHWNPYVTNPDIGVVGAPGVSHDSLQVASLENEFIDLEALTYGYGEEKGKAGYLSAGNIHPFDLEQNTFQLLDAGLGSVEDFEGKNFNGKFALIQRGEYAFTEKTLNAQAAGAAGAIIYNNTDGIVNMATEDTINIPQMFMLKSDGVLLAEQLENDSEVTITFGDETVKIQNPTAGQMSDFTSWGLTPDLDFKPEITAPGGNILSTLQDDQYGVMSGTSMAAPHVAGGSALVLQRVDEAFNLDHRARVEMAKNLLMNTSEVVNDKGYAQSVLEQDNPYSPRRQGAGLMQLHSAIKTPVVVTEKQTGEAKVALKEVGDQFSMTLEAKNLTDEAVSYDLAANVQTDFAFNGVLGNAFLSGELDKLEAQEVVGAKVNLNNGKETVEVPANGSVTVDVQVDLSEAKVFSEPGADPVKPEEIFTNGYFVEGYVTLTDSDDVNPS